MGANVVPAWGREIDSAKQDKTPKKLALCRNLVVHERASQRIDFGPRY